jgi:hypothetical protein
MASAHSKAATAEAPIDRGNDTLTRKVRERRRKLIASINASDARDAEQAEAELTKYLDDVYPETRLSDQ